MQAVCFFDSLCRFDAFFCRIFGQYLFNLRKNGAGHLKNATGHCAFLDGIIYKNGLLKRCSLGAMPDFHGPSARGVFIDPTSPRREASLLNLGRVEKPGFFFLDFILRGKRLIFR